MVGKSNGSIGSSSTKVGDGKLPDEVSIMDQVLPDMPGSGNFFSEKEKIRLITIFVSN